jgi:hypothetical protein
MPTAMLVNRGRGVKRNGRAAGLFGASSRHTARIVRVPSAGFDAQKKTRRNRRVITASKSVPDAVDWVGAMIPPHRGSSLARYDPCIGFDHGNERERKSHAAGLFAA